MSIQIHSHLITDSNIPSKFNEVLKQVYSDEMILKSKLSETINLQYAHSIIIANIDSTPIGRLMVYKNPFHIINEKNVLSIGFIEAIENEDVWSSMLKQVKIIAHELKVKYIIGPLNGSTWEQYRFTEKSDKPLFLSEPFYPNYYQEFLQKQGFKGLSNYISNIDRIMDWRKERILKKEEELKSILTIRPINKENLKQELDEIYPLVLEAFEDNFLYSPIDKEVFTEKYLKLKSIITEEMVLIAEDKITGEKAGFIFAFPDLLNKIEKGFIIKTLARNKQSKYAGIGSVLSNIVTKYAKENNYTYCIHAMMISSNSSTSISASFTGELLKKHTLYYKDCSYE